MEQRDTLLLVDSPASVGLYLSTSNSATFRFVSARTRPIYIYRAMSSLSSRTRSAPAGFVEPCLPSPAEKPPSGSNSIHEIKHDGYRLMARRDPVCIRLLARSGNDWSTRQQQRATVS